MYINKCVCYSTIFSVCASDSSIFTSATTFADTSVTTLVSTSATEVSELSSSC